MTERTITICGHKVAMIYCAATENGFETIADKKISVFIPTFGKDDDGNDIIVEPAQATIGDYITLAVAAIIAAYTRKGQEPPITANDILYEATPQERNLLLTTVSELRNEWYQVPKAVAETLENETDKHQDGDGKNA